MNAAERLALGLVAAERTRRANVAGAEVFEVDGLVLALANLPDPALSSVVVRRRPHEAHAALSTAEAEFDRRGMRFGIDLQAGRHPGLDEAIRSIGLTRMIERPGMVADPRALPHVPFPSGVEMLPVESPDDAEALVQVGVLAFGDDLTVGRAFYGAAALGSPHSKAFVARRGDDPIGISACYRHGRTIGVMGVGVVPGARRRGVGAALTVHAARWYRDADLVWLHPSDEARSLYERLGFYTAADWEVWARSPIRAGAAVGERP